MDERLKRSIKKLLRHSFQDIELNYFDYELLTDVEKMLVSREEFAHLVTWLQEG